MADEINGNTVFKPLAASLAPNDLIQDTLNEWGMYSHRKVAERLPSLPNVC